MTHSKLKNLLKIVVQGTYEKLINVHKQNSKNLPNTKKIATKSDKVVKFVDNKKITKMITKHKKKSDISNDKKNTITKNDSVAEIQVSDLDTSTEIEDNNSMGWRSLPEIPSMSENSDTCDTDETE